MNTRETSASSVWAHGPGVFQDLIEDGYRLVGTDPVPATQEEFKALGGAVLASPKEVAEAADFVFISVPNSKISLECARGRKAISRPIRTRNRKP